MNINIELKNVAYNNVKTEEIEITENGEYTPSEGYDAIEKAIVNVEPSLEELNATENGEYLPSEGKDGFSKVDVLVQPNTQEIEITENGEYTPSQGYIGFNKVDVNVETYEPPLNLVLTNPTADSNINLPITFQWNIDNLEVGETAVYYLFVDDTLVYKGNNTSYTMQAMPIAGRNHICYVVANTTNRSCFTNSVSFSLPYEFLYGFDIDQSIQDPADAVTYTDDCLNFTPAGLDNNDEFQFGSWKTFIDRLCRPVMLRTDGTVDYELDHDNLTAKIDGTSSDISNLDYDGNAMVEFKKVYTKVWQEDDIIKVRFCDVKLDSNFQAWAFVNDDGDEQNEFYHSMFHAINYSGHLRSIISSNMNYRNVWYTENRTSSSNLLNNMDEGYRPLSYINAQYIRLLHILISKTRDSSQTFGSPYKSYTSLDINNINKGGFIGNKNASTTLTETSFYIQHFYSCGYSNGAYITILDGLYTDINGYYCYKNLRPYPTYDNYITDDFINTGLKRNITSGYLVKMTVKNGIIFPTNIVNNDSSAINKYYTSQCSDNGGYNINHGCLSPNPYNCKSIYGIYFEGPANNRVSTFITYIKPTQQ